MYYIEFVEFLGEIRNNTGTNGKSFIFKVVDVEHSINFEAVLFVHPTVQSFITLDIETTLEKSLKIHEEILNKFKIEELLAYEN